MAQSFYVLKELGALNIANGGNLHLGNDGDGFAMSFDGTDTLNIDADTANDAVRLGESTLTDFQVDVTSGNDLLVDASANQLLTPTLLNQTTATAVGTGNQTLSAAELLGGVIDDDPEGAATWTTDTAANIVAAIPNARVGLTFDVVLHNDATAASGEVVTLAGGTGVTIAGTALTLTEGTNETGLLRLRLTNVTSTTEAVDGYLITNA